MTVPPLGRPFNGASLILDAGATDDIPDHIRRAVILRDKHCQWPGGCEHPASRREPHHPRPRCEGGETSVDDLHLYCLAHHHVFIHRLGWRIIHHPDGSREATGPNGWVIRSHDPPGLSERGQGKGNVSGDSGSACHPGLGPPPRTETRHGLDDR
ncbi:MAG TPA: hypothetical protein VMG38_06610 [Trebonia sp.]|nr:hypothetical protein [Trebonia sp.]